MTVEVMTMEAQRIYADLNKWEEVDGQFQIILTTLGTHRDLQKYGIALKEGLRLDFWMDDEDSAGNPDPLYFQGTVHYNETTQNWVAVVAEEEIRNASDFDKPDTQEVITINPDLFDTFVEGNEFSTRPSAKPKAAPKRPIKL